MLHSASCRCHRATVSTFQIFWVLLSTKIRDQPRSRQTVQQTEYCGRQLCVGVESDGGITIAQPAPEREHLEPGSAESYGWMATTFPFAEPLAACIWHAPVGSPNVAVSFPCQKFDVASL
jgi:hypothetical protein